MWMVIGIILLSMFTAQVSSRLTTQELKSEDYLVDKKVKIMTLRVMWLTGVRICCLNLQQGNCGVTGNQKSF